VFLGFMTFSNAITVYRHQFAKIFLTLILNDFMQKFNVILIVIDGGRVDRISKFPIFQKLQKERLDVSGANTVLSIHRGTATIQAKDIPVVSQPSLKGQKITTNRGTSVRVL